ncbi:MAG: pre-peptidase C-terminal domain-containing protein [Leptolyngbyaceae cyanobacterium]
MPQVSLSTSTNFDGDLNALVEDQSTSLTVRFDLDEPAPEGGLRVYVDSEVEQIINRLDLPGFVASPTLENIALDSLATNFDNSGFAVTIDEGATFGSFTINVFDNPEPDTFLPETFDGLVEAALSLRTQAEVDSADQNDITGLGDYIIDPAAASSTVIFADEASQLTDTPGPPTPPTPPTPDGLQVSLFTGPDYLIEDEGTVSAHAFLATNGVIPEGGLIVSVDAPNLSEFDLAGVSVEGGEVVAVRDSGFDLRMTEYTTLVNLPIAADGETEEGETATFSLAEAEGYEIISDYSSGTFNLVDTEADIARGVVTEPNDIISSVVTDTEITLENPSFSAAGSLQFDIGNRYLNEDGTYTYIDSFEDVDLYQVELDADDTVAVEILQVKSNNPNFTNFLSLGAFDADGNRLAYTVGGDTAARDRLFLGGTQLPPFNEDGTVNENRADDYLELVAPENGIYYFGVAAEIASRPFRDGGEDFAYSVEIPGLPTNSFNAFRDYEIEINLLTPDNPILTGTPTPPVSNPDVTNPPTLSLSASPITTDSEGNFTPAVVEFIEDDGISSVTFTFEAEGEIPEAGIELVLNSNVDLFDYVSFNQQATLPASIGGQSLGAFYNEEGIPTGIRLLMEEPLMTVTLQRAAPSSGAREFSSFGPLYEQFEGLETDGAEDVTFFIQSGEGYNVATDAGTSEVTYYDTLADVPPLTGGSDTVPEVGITISETELIESEQTETTLTFTLSEPPPATGVNILLDSDNAVVVGSVLSQFDVLEAEISGGDFPLANGDRSGFFFNITEQTATINLSAFDELTVPGFDPGTFQEGILDLTFALQPQSNYTIDPDASEINLSILDNPDSQILVLPTAATVDDADSTSLIESQGTVGVLTLSLGAPPPETGLTVSVSTNALAEFDTETIEVAGGTLAAVRENGFDVTLTERQATINLPVLSDGVAEGSETATFTVEPGDGYEIAPAVSEVSFQLADDLGQGFSEEIESNDVLSEANVLGLSAENPTVSISGALPPDAPGSEDVDLYSVTLAAGQTLTIDIDGEEAIPADEVTEFPATQEVPQRGDHELRLFDAAGSELAANNDGAAPGEEFSRDPYLEFTADSAGTYYIGVSQLGNRNYDPNVEGSGSGWIFPEVGVLFGGYELTATLTEGGTGGGLTGTDDTDTLTGTAGDDLLDGLLGDDTYTGGAGTDQFVLGIAQGIDTITDFEVGTDQISLGGLTPDGVKFFELSSDTLVLTNSNELIGVVQGVTGLDNSVFA